jgi:hypothetical protein
MTTLLELRTAAMNLNQACGDLDKGYDRGKAIELGNMVRRCMPIVGENLDEGTPDQQVARGDLHRACDRLDKAIRQALLYPQRTELGEEVVRSVQDLRSRFAGF